MNEREREPLTFVSLALALANDYSRLFVINPENDSYSEYSPDGEDKELVRVSGGDDFFADVRRDALEQVWPEDQEYFLSAFKKENVGSALKDGSSFSLNYRLNINGEPRYFFLKTIRANDRSIIIGVQDVDAEKRREQEKAAASRTYSEIAESLASLFEVIYYIDIETGSYSQYSSSESFERLGLGHDGKDFFTMADRDIGVVIHEDDRDRIRAALERDALLSKVRTEGTLSLVYRQILDNRTQYVNLIAFRQQKDAERLVIGVRNIDKQVMEKLKGETYSHIAEALASRYEAIYYIDIETDEYTLYSTSDNYAKLGTSNHGTDFFKETADDIIKYLHIHDVQRMVSEMQKERLLENLKREGTLSFTYRQQLNGNYQYMNMIVVQPKNDSHHIVMGVFNIDAQTRRTESIQLENQRFSDIALALAMQYEVIYRVDLNTNEYTEYSASEKYTRLKIGTTGKDFFAETAENMKHDIYPEDLPMMQNAMNKEVLLSRLAGSGKTFLNYRLMLDNRPQYVSLYAIRSKEDADHIIVAVANVDAAKRMELDYRNAIDLANRDALTGVKNKSAYAQAEMELDEAITQNRAGEFAVVICDLNGLKGVNDTQGHKAGDEFIKQGCSVICDVFDHSPVFRIGGDEFAVIMKGRDFENRKSLEEQFCRIQKENLEKGQVTMACGISVFNPMNDMRVQDVFERADAMMYENKKNFKENR